MLSTGPAHHQIPLDERDFHFFTLNLFFILPSFLVQTKLNRLCPCPVFLGLLPSGKKSGCYVIRVLSGWTIQTYNTFKLFIDKITCVEGGHAEVFDKL